MLKIIGSEAMGNHIVKKIQDKKKGLTNNENVKKNETMSFTLKHSSYISLVNVEGNNFKKLDIIVQCFF
jgi:hypothetical protein